MILTYGLDPFPGVRSLAPFIQDIFDRPLAEERPNIAAKIREHTSMKLA
jgi:hypothetical protein